MPVSFNLSQPAHLRRTGLTLVTAGLLLAAPLTASAHVRVAADHPVTGSFSALTFRVPNESPTASTVKVSVELPTDHPFLFVSSKPVPGWTVEATEATLPQPVEREGTTITKATRTVAWTAEGGAAIKPEQYQEFSLSVGPLPDDPAQILLPAIQTYSDGKVVRWDQPTPASGAEPENPAPVLEVTKAEAQTAPTTNPAEPTAAVTAASADGTARGLAGAALAVSVVGLVVAMLSLRRRVRPA